MLIFTIYFYNDPYENEFIACSRPGAFGSSGGSIFGGGGSTFGQPAQQGSMFQSAGE